MQVTSVEFTMLNLNSSTLSASPVLTFYADSGSGTPGSVIDSILFNPISVAGSSYEFLTYTAPSSIFTASQTFWVGESFSNNGVTLTTAQLNNFGVIYETAASVGSDGAQYFISSGGSAIGTASPSGTLHATSGSAGTMGIEMTGVMPVSPTPEPGTIALMTTGLAFVGEAVRRKRRLA
jgi:hypothetical protein